MYDMAHHRLLPRLLPLLCLILCSTSAKTTADARRLLVPRASPESGSATVSGPSPSPRSTPANGGDSAAAAGPPPSSGDSRGAVGVAVSLASGGEGAPGSESAVGPEQLDGRGHRSPGNSVGGDVIIGGLATAFLAAIACYIRVTRRRDDEEKS